MRRIGRECTLVKVSKRKCSGCPTHLVQRPEETPEQFAARYLCLGCEEIAQGRGGWLKFRQEELRRAKAELEETTS